MNPLMITSRIGKQVDALLGNVEPIAGIECGANGIEEFIGRAEYGGHGVGYPRVFTLVSLWQDAQC